MQPSLRWSPTLRNSRNLRNILFLFLFKGYTPQSSFYMLGVHKFVLKQVCFQYIH